MARKMKYIIAVLLVFMGFGAYSQTGIMGGLSLLKPFNDYKPFYGLHLGIEIPRDESQSFYLKLTNYFRNRDKDFTPYTVYAIDELTTPYSVDVQSRYSSSFLTIEGGTRYYLVGTYDFGFGLYGGTNLFLGYSSIRRELSSYDESLYQDDVSVPEKGGVILFGAGLQAGLKYTVASMGTFYLEPSGSLSLLAQPSNNTAAVGYRGSAIFLNLHIGFRKDIF